mgnify:FL=1
MLPMFENRSSFRSFERPVWRIRLRWYTRVGARMTRHSLQKRAHSPLISVCCFVCSFSMDIQSRVAAVFFFYSRPGSLLSTTATLYGNLALSSVERLKRELSRVHGAAKSVASSSSCPVDSFSYPEYAPEDLSFVCQMQEDWYVLLLPPTLQSRGCTRWRPFFFSSASSSLSDVRWIRLDVQMDPVVEKHCTIAASLSIPIHLMTSRLWPLDTMAGMAPKILPNDFS